MGREREGPKRFLGNFEGILQSDGYGAYDHVGGARIVHAACWAHATIEAARIDALPKSPLAKACNYTLTLWSRLTRFLDYPVLELSNNLAENAIRPVALGRNWIHVGSKEAGPRVAAIISVVETCRRLKIPVREYLGAALPGLADFPISRIAELTPAAWATRN